MHKSRMAGIVIDCQSADIDTAARFWAAALGRKAAAPAHDGDRYRDITGPEDEIKVLVQSVNHPSRVHLDIETDDVEAEVRRLEGLGATRVQQVDTWWVMEAPSGHRFCVVRVQRPDFEAHANRW